jgi:hypothetical protein
MWRERPGHGWRLGGRRLVLQALFQSGQRLVESGQFLPEQDLTAFEGIQSGAHVVVHPASKHFSGSSVNPQRAKSHWE